jgi:serine/threonine-protein kinase RsbW
MLPNDANCLRLARTYVQEMCALAGLKENETQALILATDEACTNTIEHAFEPGEAGVYSIKGDLTPLALTLAIHDRGLPFDASLAPVYQPPQETDIEGASTHGLGLYLIRRAVDEVQWINHGREGKELRLTKYRPQSDVTAQLPAADLAPFRNDEPQAPPQEYAIRWMLPGDTVWVAQCIYRAYGRTHPNEFLYYPERMAHMLDVREIIAAVAVGADGDLAGFAIARPGAGKVGELHEVVVAPRHRGRGLLKRMVGPLDEEMRRVGTRGVFVEPVTNHLLTQRVVSGIGFRDCAVTLGAAPASQYFKGFQTGPILQRGSWTLAFKYLTPPAASSVYAPEHHRSVLQRIYEHLGTPVTWKSPGGSSLAQATEPGQVQVSFFPAWGFGSITVAQPGRESLAEIRRSRRDLCDLAGAEAIYLELPLAWPETPELCAAVESDGFFFAGLGPQFASDGDVLRLQYLNTPLVTAQIQLLDPFTKEMLAYVDGERTRVGQS